MNKVKHDEPYTSESLRQQYIYAQKMDQQEILELLERINRIELDVQALPSLRIRLVGLQSICADREKAIGRDI